LAGVTTSAFAVVLVFMVVSSKINGAYSLYT
jgi:hypothetical protein